MLATPALRLHLHRVALGSASCRGEQEYAGLVKLDFLYRACLLRLGLYLYLIADILLHDKVSIR